MTPSVSVLVPACNEEGDIAGCIDSIASSELRPSEYEVLLIDGKSTDRTVQVASDAARAAEIRLSVVENPDGHVAAGLNAGVSRAAGDVIVRVDARARIGASHLRLCRELLSTSPRIGVVGGGQRPVPRPAAGWQERAAARALANRFTTGLARYRTSRRACEADTVWMGAFRRADVQAAGGWPDWPRQNQDFRLNQAIRQRGLIVWFDPRLDAEYLVRREFVGLARQHFRFGRAKGLLWRSGTAWSPRHGLLLSAPLLAAGIVTLSARHVGVRTTFAGVALVLISLDHFGSDGPAPLGDRLGAVAATIIADGCWLLGVVRGATG